LELAAAVNAIRSRGCQASAFQQQLVHEFHPPANGGTGAHLRHSFRQTPRPVSCSNSRISHIGLRRKRNRLFIAPVGVTFMGEVIAVVWAD